MFTLFLISPSFLFVHFEKADERKGNGKRHFGYILNTDELKLIIAGDIERLS